MPLNLPTFYKRTASAIVFAAVMLTGLLWNTLAFVILVCLIQLACYREYIGLMQRVYPRTSQPVGLKVVMQIGALIFIIAVAAFHEAFYKGDASYSAMVIYSNALYLWLFVPVLPAIFFALSLLRERTYFDGVLHLAGGLLYITVPMYFLLALHNISYLMPIALVVMIWINDTMAYLVGSFIGRTPFSTISPKKTWEGTVGGGILTIVGAGLYGYYSQKYRLIDWMMLAMLVSIFGPIGDLMESKLKRMANVKDSGNIMPGHGGALDRFDSLLVATPFVFVYVDYFMR